MLDVDGRHIVEEVNVNNRKTMINLVWAVSTSIDEVAVVVCLAKKIKKLG